MTVARPGDWLFSLGRPSIAVAVLLFATPLLVRALDPSKAVTQYAAEVWNAEAGLPLGAVSVLAQTPDGYLWAGTSEGLARFDGARFTVFTPGSAEGLASNYITALAVDARGALWIGTANGLSRYAEGTFEKFTTVEGLGHDVVHCIESGGDGSLWVGTNGGGLSWFDGGKFRTLTSRDGLLSDTVTSLALDADGRLWIGTLAGVNTLKSGHLAVYSKDARLLRTPPWLGRKPGSPICGFAGGGLAVFQEKGVRPLAPLKSVSCVLEDMDGNLWVGTPKGAYRLAGDACNLFCPEVAQGEFPVNAILEDREGSLWIAGDLGLWRLKNPRVTPFGTPEGLPLDTIYTLCAGPSGAIRIGGVGGLATYEDGAFSHFPAKGNLSDETVIAILEDSRGDLWIGTKGGLDLLRDGKITRQAMGALIPRVFIISLCEDTQGRIWVGTRGSGLFRIQGKEVRRYTAGEGLTDNYIGALCASRDGTLWVGGTAGLSRLDPGTGRVVRYTTKEGLAANYILSLYEDADGVLWVGSWGGITRIQDGRLTAMTPRQGLPNDVIYQILEDGLGRLWMSSPQGIFSVLKREMDELARGVRSSVGSTVFTEQDGMRARRCLGTVQPAGGRAPSGQLWFPTVAGIVLVEPGDLRACEDVLPVLIESVTVDGKAFRATEPVIAPPGKRNVELTFTAPTFRNPAKVSFRYRLDGFDQGWTEVGSRRSAYYTNLPKGAFIFRVTACNEDGVWNPEGVALKVTLKPFFYETWWFGLLCVSCVALILGAAVQWRFRRLEIRKRELESLVAVRTAQLEEANRELERLANEDGLTRIPNIRHFQACLDGEWRRAIRDVKPISILLIDVDHFKKFNDRYGHQAGDECLRSVAGVLKGCVKRAGDMAARYGGEEFIVLLTGADAAGAALLAQDLRQGVEALGIIHEDSDAAQVVTISVGCATALPREGKSSAELIGAADHALYRSKSAGRNRSTSVDLSEIQIDSERWT